VPPESLISLADHDLLIQLHTKLDTLTSKLGVLETFDTRLREIENKDQRHSEKISNLMTEMTYVKQTTVQLTRINDLESDFKDIRNELVSRDRVDAIADDVADLKKKSNLADIIISAGTLITGFIAYFKH